MQEKVKQKIPFVIDDFFSSQEQRDENSKEKVEDIDISLIDDFANHPFKILKNDEFESLKESIKINGILSPTIVRKKLDGRYEMISGHRRKYASKLLGLTKIPCIIRNLNNDEATIYMVDSNLQREKLLPSEKAFAYKMKLDAVRHQGKQTSRPLVGKLESADVIGEEYSESGRQVQRYIRLTYLISELLDMVDNSELGESPSIALRPAVELSYLTSNEQKVLLEFIDANFSTPSLAQSIQLKKLSQANKLTEETLDELLIQQKPNQINKFKIEENKLFDVIPRNIARDKVEDYVIKACSYYTNYLKQKDKMIER